jgi:mannose/fructose/N-acetylgalactosamine-specific phosphotransferase system component IIB
MYTVLPSGDKVRVVVCPKQKLIKVFGKGKKGKGKLIKSFRFKEVVPKVEKTITVSHYDWGEWSVSERETFTEKVVQVYDEKVIESIKQRATEYYLSTLKK